MANRLNWSLGHEGKGNWYSNGDISTWNIDDYSNPHHHEVATRDVNSDPGKRSQFMFYISPQGGLHDGGIGFNNSSPYDDDKLIREIVAQHPAIYDARQEGIEDPSLEPRVEMQGGGYGHAYNLMDAISKIAKEEGWADFHAELKLPRGVRREVRKWADKLDWPSGSKKDDQRSYHITILSMDEYDENFARWMRKQIRGRSFHFESTGMDIFGDEHVVLRLESPEWTKLVESWQKVAEKKGLEPRIFDPPKAHITIGKSPNGRPEGASNPHIDFETSVFNINKNAAVLNEYGKPEEDWDFGRPWEPGSWGKGFLDRRDQPVIWQTSSPQSGAMQPIHYDYADWLTRKKEDEGETPDDAWQDPENMPIVIAPNGEYSLAPDWAQRGIYADDQALESFADAHPNLTMLDPDRWTQLHLSQESGTGGYGHAQNVIDILNKNSMAERSGNALLDELIEKFVEWHDPSTSGEGQGKYPIDELRDPARANGYCDVLAQQFATYLISMGLDASNGLPASKGPYMGPEMHPDSWGYQDRSIPGWNSHAVTTVNMGGETFMVDWTASQYGYSEFPMVQRLAPNVINPTWEREWKQSANSLWHEASEQTIADELKQWLDSFTVEQPDPLSIHHTSPEDFQPQVQQPVATQPFVDPPSHPYQPYDWATDGWEESPLDRIASIKAYEEAQYPSGRSLDTEPKEPEDEADGINGDKLVYYDGPLGASWFVTDGTDGDFVSGPWSDEDEARSINEREWKTAASDDITTHPCPKCNASIEGSICNHCGYDPHRPSSEYERAKGSWYDKAWSEPGQQSRPVPNQPLHWRDDGARDIKFSAMNSWHTSDQRDISNTADTGSWDHAQRAQHSPRSANQSGISNAEAFIQDSRNPGWQEGYGWREI